MPVYFFFFFPQLPALHETTPINAEALSTKLLFSPTLDEPLNMPLAAGFFFLLFDSVVF